MLFKVEQYKIELFTYHTDGISEYRRNFTSPFFTIERQENEWIRDRLIDCGLLEANSTVEMIFDDSVAGSWESCTFIERTNRYRDDDDQLTDLSVQEFADCYSHRTITDGEVRQGDDKC